MSPPQTSLEHRGLSEVLMAELAAPRDLEVEIQRTHDEGSLVAIEIVPPEPFTGDQTIRVSRRLSVEDFITTIKFPSAAKTEDERTGPFVRGSAPYELVELAMVPEARDIVRVAAIPDPMSEQVRTSSELGTTIRRSGSLDLGWFDRPTGLAARASLPVAALPVMDAAPISYAYSSDITASTPIQGGQQSRTLLLFAVLLLVLALGLGIAIALLVF